MEHHNINFDAVTIENIFSESDAVDITDDLSITGIHSSEDALNTTVDAWARHAHASNGFGDI